MDTAVNFNNAISLIHAEWLQDSPSANSVVDLVTIWQINDPTQIGPIVPPTFTTDVAMFAQVLGADGSPLAQRDALDAPSWGWQSGDTLIQKTFSRLNKFIPTENILILTNERYNDLVLEHLPMVKQEQVVLEPGMRNTAPCILYAALKIQKMNPGAYTHLIPTFKEIPIAVSFFQILLFLSKLLRLFFHQKQSLLFKI